MPLWLLVERILLGAAFVLLAGMYLTGWYLSRRSKHDT